MPHVWPWLWTPIGRSMPTAPGFYLVNCNPNLPDPCRRPGNAVLARYDPALGWSDLGGNPIQRVTHWTTTEPPLATPFTN